MNYSTGIEMESEWYEVVSIIKKTKASFFKDLKVGDLVVFSTELAHTGGGRSLYATSVECRTQTGERTIRSMSDMSNRLHNFDLKTLEEQAVEVFLDETNHGGCGI